MFKKFEIFAAGLLLLIASGCTETAIINGHRYEILTGDEEKLLVRMATHAMENSPKALSPAEVAECRTVTPTLKIEYMDDRAGQARVIWELKGKRVVVGIAGTFFSSDMQWLMYSELTEQTLIDTRGGGSGSVKGAVPANVPRPRVRR